MLEPVSARYGAPMGRPNFLDAPNDEAVKLHLQRMRLVDGDYDVGGAYWGAGSGEHTLWVAASKEQGKAEDEKRVRIVTRARDREAAKEEIREFYPNARFFR